ncbi:MULTISPECIES: phospho-sugar mutase [unclassified Cryobacterium]|uniref:phospho-sugar mutase n=1 Tax=unclassified Cryobacterium TaxID=2649013 RepID=UPI001F545190|nr:MULTISPECIES: phospho-sugar mutase [unclassified Cryobacterium]
MSATETGTGPTSTGPTSTGPVDSELTGTGEVRARGRHRALPDAPASALPPTLALEIVEIPVPAAAQAVPVSAAAEAAEAVPAAAEEPAAAPLTAHPASAADEQAPVTAEMDATVAAAFVPAARAHPVRASTTSAPAPAPDDATTVAAATAWLAQDPDPETQAELRALLRGAQSADETAITELHARFDERLAFGTAGLRGAIGAGSNRMNRVLVSQAAAGLAAFLIGTALPGQTPSVVIGYDGRKNSQVFAADSAAIMAGAGVRAILLPRLLPTPVLAFAVRHLDASAGVMVTASHNPAADNGYKVYLGGANSGSQIVSPDDAFIAAEIHRVATHTTIPDLPRGVYETAEETVVQAYIAATAATVGPPRAQVNAVYTAMHGVGWDTTRRVLEAAGYDLPTLVDAQIAPDPTFPTVAFPNPEEPGALDLAFATAREINAELIIANDPDADRLAIAIPDADAAGGYRRLTGNEVGAILGWRAAERAELAPIADDAATDDDADTSAPAPRSGTLACSIVSSPALKAVADAYGMRFEETLTGFKWVSRAPGLVFGYEEALGYLVNPTTARDKDGISAALALLSLVSDLKNEGFTLADHLHHFSGRFGHFSSSQISVRVTDLSSISRVMDRLRSNPPVFIGRIRVDHIDDLAGGFLGLPPSDVLRIRLVGGARVMVRPSGTEPKLKVYLDTSSVVGTVVERQVAANAVLAELERGMRELIA